MTGDAARVGHSRPSGARRGRPTRLARTHRIALAALAVLSMLLAPLDVEAQRGRRARPRPEPTPTAEPAAPAPAPAEAAPTSATAAREPTAADRQAAGQAYDRATAAYLARDYPRAATLFETAYRLAPASAALLQAVRSHERAGNRLRAATLALRLQAFYGSDEAAQRQAEQTIAASAAELLRIDVTCASTCTLELDGQIQEHTSFFATPGAAHTVRASFDTGTVERSISGAAGATERVAVEAPPAAPIVAEVGGGASEGTETSETDGSATTGPTTPPPGSGGGVSPIVFGVMLALTAGAGGTLLWSGIDTLAGVPAYNAAPTTEGLRDGQTRELRTNILIGVTGALGLTTLILAIVTDWDGDPAVETEAQSPAVGPPEPVSGVSASAIVGPDLAVLTLQGNFR